MFFTHWLHRLGAPEFLRPCSALIPPAASDQECAAGSSRHLRDEAGRRSHSESSRTVTRSHPLGPPEKGPTNKGLFCPAPGRVRETSAESIRLTDSRYTSTPPSVMALWESRSKKKKRRKTLCSSEGEADVPSDRSLMEKLRT